MYAMGFRTQARYGVEIIMLKDRDDEHDGGYTLEPTTPTHPLYTDHPLLFAYLAPHAMEEELISDVSPKRDLLAEHETEYKAELLRLLAEQPPAVTATPADRMRWAAEHMKMVGQQLTVKYRKTPGKKYMHYPRRIQKLHDKLRGLTPRGPDETSEQLKKRVTRAMTIWLHKRLDKVQQTRDQKFDSDAKRTYHMLMKPPATNGRVIEEEACGGYYTKAEDRDECARRVIGSQWKAPPNASLRADPRLDEEWQKYVRADPQDTLEGIGTPVTKEEITEAYKHMSKGKATQHDCISKELMEIIPDAYMDMFVEYVGHAFNTGHTEVQEGQTDVVLLTKKLDKNANEITNKRPIALMKFVAKWLHAILAHRIQTRVHHLANYGFQPGRSTMAAVRKIIALIEHAQLTKRPIHLLTVDLEKSYDSVPYELIKRVLRAHNCPDRIIHLILETHTNRALHFKIDKHIGHALTPERGVAQGSPLSCILFVMCIQPLLLRLKDQTIGLWGVEDDVAYVDDVTLITGTATQLEIKWATVRSFETWTKMRINLNKCEYDTTEPSPAKWAHLPGVTHMRWSDNPEEAVRILGFWEKITGERKEQLDKIQTSIRLVSLSLKRKLMSPAIATGIINQILTSRLNYTAQLHEMPSATRHAIQSEINQLARHQFGLCVCVCVWLTSAHAGCAPRGAY